VTVIATTERLADIARPDWDGLVGDDGFYLSHDWLSYVESEQAEQPRYLLATDSGIPRGALTLYRVLQAPNLRYRAEHFRDLLGVPGRTLLAGACRGYRSTLLLPPSGQTSASGDASASGDSSASGDASRTETLASRAETLAALIESARAQATEEGCAGIVLPFLTTGGLLEVAAIAPVRAAFEMPEAEIRGCDQGMDGYAERAPRRVRARIRTDRARFGQAGWSVRERNLDDCWRDAARLLEGLERRHDHTQRTLEQLERQLAGQAKHLADRSVVFTCEDDDGMAGIAVFYRWRSTLYGRLAGFDYDRLRDGREYFNIVIYAPVEHAARAAVKNLQLGAGSWEAKGYRGATLRPLWTAFIPAGTKAGVRAGGGGQRPGIELINGAEVRRMAEDITHRSISIDPEEWNAPERFAAAS
jgi:predicted N-acyltransferase